MENNNIIEESKKRFQQILEYTTFRPKFVDEADDNTDNQQADPNMAQGDGADQQGQAPQQDSEMGPVGGDPNTQDTNQQPNANAQNNIPQGLNPQENEPEMSADMQGGDTAPTGDDDVIDITDLTDSQEETEEKVNDLEGKIDAKFDKVFQQIGKFEELIKASDSKIESLESEFEKRNPTQLEKLNMQTATSYPFNVRPEDYWKEKEATSNYRTGNDNNGVGQEQYTITQNDVNGSEDWKSIYDSLNEEFVLHQTMENTLNF